MKEKICVKEVCYCIRDAICFEEESCLFIPKDEKGKWNDNYLDIWDDIDEDDESLVILNPIEEFEFDRKKYFRVIKVIGSSIWDFRDVEEKLRIYTYLAKRVSRYDSKYVFYYQGREVFASNCPPIFADVCYVLRKELTLSKYREELDVIKSFLSVFHRIGDILFKSKIL